MTRRQAPLFDDYKGRYENIRLERSEDGVLEVTVAHGRRSAGLDVDVAR